MDIILNSMLSILILKHEIYCKDWKATKNKLLDSRLETGESVGIENYDLIEFNIDNL